ncbi:MAG TPA: bifunctional riboflavin kinase/FAD synthetase [Phycisphaerae bacterium]|nr:bifunctional riboflavin kinase/FAD synthetase [Phycisphaerae bacterium]
MELLRDLDNVPAAFRGGVLSVGVFDGVHLGHQQVLGRAVERARALGAAAVVFTFHPHPLQVLRPDEAPPLIQTFGQKLELMREIGIGAVVWPRDAAGVLALAPEAFVGQVVCGALAARVMVEGADFRFGRGGRGDGEQLGRLAGACAVEVELVDDVSVDGDRVSSTRIRRLIADGHVAEAARCLGRPYAYVGTVVEGRHRGARLGYPTANVEAPRFLVPGDGVYAGWVEVRGRRYASAVSVGRAPTFEKALPVAVEAFLLDFDGELYGEQMAVDFVESLRPQRAFPDEDALKVQIAADCDRVRQVLGGG